MIAANDAVSQDSTNALNSLIYTEVTVKNIDENIDSECLQNATKAIVLTYSLNAETAVAFNQISPRLQQHNIPHIELSCHNPYDHLYLNNVETNVLAYGCSGLDQTNYSIRKFDLNMSQAIKKIMTAKSLTELNTHLP